MDPHNTRKIVLVSGAPGAGKTTLAVPLADALGFALISKDHIKETLFDVLEGTPGDLAYSRKIGGAAMELLWVLAKHCPNVVLEANFRHRSDYERTRIRSLQGDVTEVYCDCPAEEVMRRFARRAKSLSYHSAHTFSSITLEDIEEFDQPVGIGTVIKVATNRPIDVAELVSRIREAWERPNQTLQDNRDYAPLHRDV